MSLPPFELNSKGETAKGSRKLEAEAARNPARSKDGEEEEEETANEEAKDTIMAAISQGHSL